MRGFAWRWGPTGVAVLLLAGCDEPQVILPANPPVARLDSGAGPIPPDAGAGPSCEPPFADCGDGCVNLATDPTHCGRCDGRCNPGAYCENGGCAAACAAGLRACGASCVDLARDRGHCGLCDRACPADRDCRGGSCVCPEGYTECRGSCVDTNTRSDHCGLCERACAGDELCRQGSCVCAGADREADCANGADDDCDDRVDCDDDDCAGTTRTCAGRCGPGTESCRGDGTWTACAGGDGSAEVCGDGIDQDCDGRDQRSLDGFEPNDGCDRCAALAVEVDPNVYLDARIDSVEDAEDCYRFDVDDGLGYPEHLIIDLSRIPLGDDYDLYLYRGADACRAGTPLASSTAPGAMDEHIDWSESFGSNDGGTYYVRVVRFRGHSCTEDYRLSINGLR